jgi:peptide/nickel transport system substrate-binding protein
MADGDDNGWGHFQKLKFDKKRTLKRLRRAETVSVRHAHKFLLKRWRNVREVRRTVVVWLLAVSCLIGAAGLQLYWDKQSYETTAGALGGTYAEAVMGPVDTLNPLFADTPAEEAISQLVFSRILSYDKTGHLNYDLAQDVRVSEDKLTYTILLRPNVRWHDGRALTADDIVYTVKLLKDPLARTQMRGWDGIEVTRKDDRTVEFHLKTAYAPFESALTFPIVPKHLIEGVSSDKVREHTFGSQPVGSGPFAFRLLQDTEVAGKKIIHLSSNDQYFGSRPKVSRLQVLVSPNEDVTLTALRTNEVHAASGVTRDLLHKLPEKRYSIQSQPIQSGVYAIMNNDSDTLSDKMVRKALQSATDTAEIRKKVGGDVPPLDLPYTDLQLSGDTSIKVPSPSYERASELLDKAGWKLEGGVRKKEGKELRLSVVTIKNTDYERALETLIGQWRRLGVQVDERIVDAADPTQNFVQSVLQPRAYDVLVYQLELGSDPDVYLYWHSSRAVARGQNLANYSSPIADDILSSARTVNNSQLRDAKHVAFAKQWLEDAPAIGLYQSVTHTVMARSVSGFDADRMLITPAQRYGEASQWMVGERSVYKTP